MLNWLRRNSKANRPVTRDEALADLKALEHSKEKLDGYDGNPNSGYKTPYDSSAYPGRDI